ncbi:MAG TPA: hypothetical protein VHZ73_07025 [Vicinamibacterales bacterium]|jgi:hypothetical protein|nr:hypothetical protein [Vicinamibacterales bacterium]
MTVETWLKLALDDADRRGIPEIKPLLEGVAKAMRDLRAADLK